MVVVADDPGNFPCAVFVLPQMNELSLADRFCIIMARVVETVNTHLNRAVALHVMDLQTAWNELPGHFAADIVLDGFCQRRSAKRVSSFVVIELHILID